MDVGRLSLNSMTVPSLGLEELIEATIARGVPAVAPWRHLLRDDLDARAAGRHLAEAGLHVSSLCRGGLFAAPSGRARASAVQDSLRAIDEAADLAADCLVLVCGPVIGGDVAGSFAMVRDGLGAIIDYAAEGGVSLGIEPLHPMMAADRSVVTTMRDAHDLIVQLGSPSGLGVVVDLYHVWWDRKLLHYVDRLRDRIVGVHVSDWVTPLSGGITAGRGMMGDGVIDIRGLVRKLPWDGYIEVEVLSEQLWREPVEETLDLVIERFTTAV